MHEQTSHINAHICSKIIFKRNIQSIIFLLYFFFFYKFMSFLLITLLYTYDMNILRWKQDT